MHSLVTGGGGFLGRYLVKLLLERGDKVTVIGRRPYPEVEKWGAHCVALPIQSPKIGEHFAGVQEVYHTAAQVGVWGKWEDYYSTNVTGTENALKAARENGVPRFIFTSSPSVTFDGDDQSGVDESVPYASQWLSPYPKSKALAEEKVLSANGRGGLYTTALRPHLIWGIGDRYLLPRIIEQGKRGKLLRVGEGKNLVDIIHVHNAALAHLKAAAQLGAGGRCNGKAYFLSQGEPVNLWEFVDKVLTQAGVASIKKNVSYKMAYRIGAALEWSYRIAGKKQEPRMTRFVAQQLAKDHYFDISASKRDFGYEVLTDVDEGLESYFSSLQSTH